MPFSWMRDSVTIVHPERSDERGADVPDWTKATRHAVAGCKVVPASTTREFGGRVEQVADGLTLIAPPGSDVAAGDRVEFGSATYEIDGSPYRWDSPTGRVSSLQAHLVEWRG